MRVRRFVCTVVPVLAAALCLPAAAAAGPALVDDPAIQDKIPASARIYFAQREAEFQATRGGGEGSLASVKYTAALWRILSTTSHKQLRNDYCVPATTTIIDHFLRGADAHWTQNQWAAYRYQGTPLWTDANGGNMWVMAMGLKSVTGVGYSYSSGNTRQSTMDRTEYAIYQKSRPVAYGVRIDRVAWPNYRIDHAGHIMCGRGFDWRLSGRIYVDDPYPENAPPPLGYGVAGGDTYGQKDYLKDVVIDGVLASASQQVVY